MLAKESVFNKSKNFAFDTNLSPRSQQNRTEVLSYTSMLRYSLEFPQRKVLDAALRHDHHHPHRHHHHHHEVLN